MTTPVFAAAEAELADTKAALADVKAEVEKLKARTSVGYENPYTIMVRDNTQAALIQARDELIASKGPYIGPARKRMILPPVTIDVTEPDALMTPGDGTNNAGLNGVIIEGSGIEATTLRFKPSVVSDSSKTGQGDPSVGNLFSANSRTRWLEISDLTIQSLNPLANAFWFYRDGNSSAQNQAIRLRDINFKGSFQRCIGLDGGATANQNSEIEMHALSTNGSPVFRDAFFKCGGISGIHNQQNQHLNHWASKCTFMLAGGVLFDYVKGGHFALRDTSISAMSRYNPAITLLKLGKNYNNLGASRFIWDNVRSEPKAANHRILDSELTHGTVVFRDCTNQSSLGGNTAAYDWPLYRVKGDRVWGSKDMSAVVVWERCHDTGYIQYDPDGTHLNAADEGLLVVDTCTWYRGQNRARAVATTDQVVDPLKDKPIIRFPEGKPCRYDVRRSNTAKNVTNVG